MKEYRVVKMFSEQLNREVRIFVMLPNSYLKSDRFYPVLYMHDGQNLFDNNTASYGVSWGVLDAYEEHPDLPEVIIVGIESDSEERSNELVPFSFNFVELGFNDYGEGNFGGKADQYISFIIDSVKPYIDKSFRTFKSAKNTAMMGSSFGGVNTTYAALKYSDYFTRFGCVSNAYWAVHQQMVDLAKESDLSNIKKMYMDVGTKESGKESESNSYIDSNNDVYNILKDKIDKDKLKYKIVNGGIHHESAWRDRFPDIIQFLFND